VLRGVEHGFAGSEVVRSVTTPAFMGFSSRLVGLSIGFTVFGTAFTRTLQITQFNIIG
jgi:hypothetical protein